MLGSAGNKKLGVCIPAYQRPEQLERCLLSVIESAHPFNVPIFIADDAPNSPNRLVVTRLQQHYPLLFYSPNLSRLGLDRNILHAANLCPCEYVWLLGEDDRMEPTGIANVLDVLSKATNLPFLVVNYRYVDPTVETVLCEKVLPLKRDTAMEAPTFFRQYGWTIGFIGSCVLRTELFRKVDPERYIGTYYAHVGVIMEMLVGKTLFVLAEPVVRNRVGSAEVFSWSDRYWEVFRGWNELTDRLKPLYGPEVCRDSCTSFCKAMGIGTLRFLCARRAERLYNIKYFIKEPLIRSHWKGLKRVAAFSIALTPPLIFCFGRYLWNRRRKRHGRPIQDVNLSPQRISAPYEEGHS